MFLNRALRGRQAIGAIGRAVGGVKTSPSPGGNTNVLGGSQGVAIGNANVHNLGPDVNLQLQAGAAEPGVEEGLAKVIKWVSKSPYHAIHEGVAKLHVDGTGQWFLETNEYKAWVASSDGKLCVTGMPGVGKTVLASFVIDTLRSQLKASPNTAVIYAYCRRDDKRDAEGILRDLIHQLLTQHPDRLPLVDKYYKKHRFDGTGPTFEEVLEMLHSLVTSFERTHIIVDGLDEIVNDKERVTLLQELHKLPAPILVFSQPLELHSKYLPTATIISVEARDQDIENFVISRLLTHPSLRETLTAAGDVVRRGLAIKIRERCGGVFLIAFLYVLVVEECDTIKSIKESINTLPTDLKGLFEDAVHRIERLKPERRGIGLKALLWATHAKRPMQTRELQEAVGTLYTVGSLELGRYNPDAVPDKRVILASTCGILTIDDLDTFRLVHETARDVFSQMQTEILKSAAEITTMVTVAHCLNPPAPPKPPRHYLHSIVNYASKNWILHLQDWCRIYKPEHLADTLSERCTKWGLDHSFTAPLVAGNQGSTSTPCPVVGYLTGSAVLLPLLWYLHRPSATHSGAALHLATQKGNAKLVEQILRSSEIPASTTGATEKDSSGHPPGPVYNPNAYDAEGRTALAVAASKGSLEVVQVLLADPRVDANARDQNQWVPLTFAASGGHLGVVQTLLADPRVDVNSRSKEGGTPLVHASFNGHLEVVQALLADPRVQAESQNADGETALSVAKANNHNAIVEALLASRNLSPA